MKYLGTYQAMFDRARIAVSDFVIVAGDHYSIDDVYDKMSEIEKMLVERE